jgi:hypothetical protein
MHCFSTGEDGSASKTTMGFWQIIYVYPTGLVLSIKVPGEYRSIYL